MIGRRALLGAVALALAGCATPGAAPAGLRSGRLLLVVAAHGDEPRRSVSTRFELQGDARTGVLRLDTPLGTRLAEASWTPTGARLRDASGERTFTDLPSLAEALLGEPLPLQALADWLDGRPWAGAPAQPTPEGFGQLGWQLDTSALSADGRLLARRDTPAPAIELRAALDR